MTHVDTWGAPSEGWPTFGPDGKRIRSEADEFVDRVFGPCTDDYARQGAEGGKKLLGTPRDDTDIGAGYYGDPIT